MNHHFPYWNGHSGHSPIFRQSQLTTWRKFRNHQPNHQEDQPRLPRPLAWRGGFSQQGMFHLPEGHLDIIRCLVGGFWSQHVSWDLAHQARCCKRAKIQTLWSWMVSPLGRFDEWCTLNHIDKRPKNELVYKTYSSWTIYDSKTTIFFFNNHFPVAFSRRNAGARNHQIQTPAIGFSNPHHWAEGSAHSNVAADDGTATAASVHPGRTRTKHHCWNSSHGPPPGLRQMGWIHGGNTKLHNYLRCYRML